MDFADGDVQIEHIADSEPKLLPVTHYEREMRRASKEVVRQLRNLERTRPDMEDDARFNLAVSITTSAKGV